MTRWLRRAALLGSAGAAWLLAGCCEGSDDSAQEGDEPTIAVPTPQMPDDWRVERDFVASRPETTAMGTQMKAKLVGVRNTVYSVKGKRVQINTFRTAGPRDALNVVRHLQNIKPAEFVLRNKNVVYEFVGRDDVLDQITAGREHLLESRQGFQVKVSPGEHQKRIKRPPLKGHDGGPLSKADAG